MENGDDVSICVSLESEVPDDFSVDVTFVTVIILLQVGLVLQCSLYSLPSFPASLSPFLISCSLVFILSYSLTPASEDYNVVNSTSTFHPSSDGPQVCQIITAVVDDRVEYNETFQLSVSTPNSRLSVDPNSATITIIDTSRKCA